MITIYSKIMTPDELALRITNTHIEFTSLVSVNSSLKPKSYEKINNGKTYCLLDTDNGIEVLELSTEQQIACGDIPTYVLPSISSAKEYIKEINN